MNVMRTGPFSCALVEEQAAHWRPRTARFTVSTSECPSSHDLPLAPAEVNLGCFACSAHTSVCLQFRVGCGSHGYCSATLDSWNARR